MIDVKSIFEEIRNGIVERKEVKSAEHNKYLKMIESYKIKNEKEKIEFENKVRDFKNYHDKYIGAHEIYDDIKKELISRLEFLSERVSTKEKFQIECMDIASQLKVINRIISNKDRFLNEYLTLFEKNRE